MGHLRKVQQVKPVFGLIASSHTALENAVGAITAKWGNIDGKTDVVPFTFSKYYNQEMGEGLVRQWLSLEQLILPDALAQIKLDANSFEDALLKNNKRTANIDPGYLGLSKLILASTKDFSHRIYVGNQVYEETTLIYRANKFWALPWSYADYQSEMAISFLTAARNRLLEQLGIDELSKYHS
jgi:hypothetical protein